MSLGYSQAKEFGEKLLAYHLPPYSLSSFEHSVSLTLFISELT